MGAIVTASEPYLLLGWAASRLGLKTVWPPESIPLASVDPDTNKIHAVVIYNAFYDGSCMMHIASAKTRRWATRSTLDQFFRYPFVTRGLSRVATQVPQSNIPAQVMCLKLGFKFEGVTRYQGENMVQLGMLREECRVLIEDDNMNAQDAALQPEQREEERHGEGPQRA